MPLCPQITNTAITVATSASYTVTSVLPVTAATSTAVNSAQSTATTALANAATAYAAAQNSLQPSAYAIQHPTTKQLTSIDATGLTVYSGASATSGARVVLNSTGLAGYNSGGSATFSVSASTGAAVFAGSVTGATITGGTLNIGGNAIIDASGYLTATGATITGAITATSGSFTGAVYASSGSFTGTLTSTAGNIGGWKISTDRIYTGASPSSPDQAIYSAGGALFTGTTTCSALGVVSNQTIGGTLTVSSTVTMNGTVNIGVNNASGSIYSEGIRTFTTGSSANVYINPTTGILARSTSSLRYKSDVREQRIDPYSILQLVPKSYVDKREYEANAQSSIGLESYLGLIAEEVAQIPVLADFLVCYDSEGRPDAINYDRIAITLIPLLKNLHERIKLLEGA